jgi:VWFA-related protein
MKILYAILSLILLSAPINLKAQVSNTNENKKLEKTLISVPVAVSDRDGRYIPNLKKEDFTLFQDGVKQKIELFGTLDEPLNIALLLDTSGSTKDTLDKIKDASGEFIDSLNPGDKCMLVTFDSQVDILSPFTSDHQMLKKSLDRVETAEKDGTVIRRAIEQIAQHSFVNAEGRKIIIVLSDGKDYGSTISKSGLLNLLEESDVLIYSILYKTGVGANTFQVAKDGSVKDVAKTTTIKKSPPKKKKVYSIEIPAQADLPMQEDIENHEKINDIEAIDYLKQMSETTAGRFYTSDAPNLKDVFKQIISEMSQQYRLGYYSKETSDSALVHDIIVKVERKDVVVRARGKFRSKEF